LSMLIRMAKGFTTRTDVSRVNVDLIVKNDSIYHLPCGGSSNLASNRVFISELNRTIKSSYTDLTKVVVANFKEKEIKQYTILYVGLPAVYVLIHYYPEFKRINFVHIPHSAVFLNNGYRLSDMFLTFGPYPTMRILEHTLKQKIDYYLIQDRSTFIDLINMLGGIELNLDKHYANEYALNQGKSSVDGFHAWEYIRFLDMRNIKMSVTGGKISNLVQKDNFEADPASWERIYEMRNQRQRYVLQGMRKSFLGISKSNQLDVINNFHKVFDTDMTNDFLMSLYKDILSTPNFAFGSLPGYYNTEGKNLYFYPDLPNFERLRQEEIRRDIEQRKSKTQTIY